VWGELQIGPNATNKKFCSSVCYRAWWKDEKFLGSSQADRIAVQLGPLAPLMWDEIDAAWLAGVIDGEGTIGIWRQWSNDRSGFKYSPVVVATNTNLAFLGRFAGLVDGKIWVKGMPRKPRHKKAWQVRVHSRVVPLLLERIRHQLVIKQRQADFVLEFCRAVAASPVHNRGLQPEFERLYRSCKALNQRGAVAT